MDKQRCLTWGGGVHIERAQAAGVEAQTLSQHRAPVITQSHANKYTSRQMEAFWSRQTKKHYVDAQALASLKITYTTKMVSGNLQD